MNTNLGKTKEEIIFELLKSLNQGNSGYVDGRIDKAIEQYDDLVSEGIIVEEN
jgi:hypothetical protein